MPVATATTMRAVLVGNHEDELIQELACVAAADEAIELAVAADVHALGRTHVDLFLVHVTAAQPFPHALLADVRANSTAPIVVVGDRFDAELLQHATSAGVRDLVLIDQPAEYLAYSLRRAADRAPATAPATAVADRPARSRIITALSLKGGSGVSTVAVNVAATCATHLEQRTLLVDLDLHAGDLALALGVNPQHTVADVAMSGGDLDADKLRGYTTRHVSGVDLLAAPASGSDAPLVRAERVRDLLRAARDGWDVVVVDTGSIVDDNLLAVLDATDELLVVTSPDAAGLRAARRALHTAEALGCARESTHVVLNRSGAPGGLATADVKNTLDRPVAHRIPDDGLVASSWNQGVPVAVDRPTAPVSRAFGDVAVAVLPDGRSLKQRLPRPRRKLAASRVRSVSPSTVGA